LLNAMNTQLVRITSMTNRLKNVTANVKVNANQLNHRDNVLAQMSLLYF